VRLNPRLGELPGYPTVLLDQKRAELLAAGRVVYDFGTGDPTEPTPEFIRRAMLASVPDNCRYPSVIGDRGIREAFAGYAERRLGVRLDPDREILPTSGSKEVVFHLPLLVIDADASDRTVVFPDPGYSVYYRGAVLAGGRPYPQKLVGDFVQRPWELPTEVLRQTRLLWINSPHNPTGAVMSRRDLERTWELCREHDILLVADECYLDVWSDSPPTSILQVAREGVLAVFSLSKRSGMTGYRSGIVAGDPAWIQRFRELRTNPGIAPQDFVNAAASAAWSEDGHAEERRRLFGAKRALLTAFLAEAGMEVVATGASFYLWFRAPPGYSGASYAEHLLSAGILTNPGSFFAVTDAGDAYVRLALVPDLEGIRAAIDAWRRIL
jgi:succinyldiaminopimelate transaminase